MNIVFCTDSLYFKPTLVSMLSVLENSDEPIHFYILHSDLSNEEIKNAETIAKKYNPEAFVTAIEVKDPRFDILPIHGRSKVAYFRLLIPQLLPHSLDRCLYLDSDAIVNKPIKSFYNTPFDNTALVVSEDMGELIHFHKEMHAVLGIPKEYKYFNSGVLLFDVGWFKNFNMNSVFTWIQNNANKLKFLDQDILNANFYDKVKYVDGFAHDYLEILMSPLLPNTGIQNASIIHFLKKPWRYDYNGVNALYWWKYGKKIYGTRAYFLFIVINFCYRKILQFLNIFIPIHTLKKINDAWKN